MRRFTRRSDALPRNAIYGAINEHWVHAEQTRWWLLYDFLMANSILILAWAAVFSAGGGAKRLVMYILCVAGVFLCSFWLALSKRANSFVDMYGALGQSTESQRPSAAGPFSKAYSHRKELRTWWKWVRTSLVLMIIPVLFILVYVALGIVVSMHP